jgi:hypothetical protein
MAAGAVSCTDSTSGAPWCAVDDPDAVLRVNGPEERPMMLRAAWRQRGADPRNSFGRPFDLTVRSDGWTAVADLGLRAPILLSPSGNWNGPAVEAGSGENQIGVPGSVRWSAGGNLLVADPTAAKILEVPVPGAVVTGRLDLSGEAATRYRAVSGLREFLLGSDGLLVERRWFNQGPGAEGIGTAGLVSYDVVSGTGPDTLMSVETRFVRGVGLAGYSPGHLQPLMGAGPGGAIALAGDIPEYRVRILGSDRTDSLVVCRTVDALPLSDDERGQVSEGEEVSRSMAALAGAPVAERPLAMGRVFIGGDGRLWVQRQRERVTTGYPEGATYDFFAPGGEYEGTVTAPPGAILFGSGGGLVVGVYRDPENRPWVTGWHLVRVD